MKNTLLGLLHNSVQCFPDKVAVIQGDTQVSYQSLWHKACGLARHLIENGLQPGDRVSILIENSPEYIASYYGVLMAGGAVVGLNTAAKSRDLANWIKHSGSVFLIGNASHLEIADTIKLIEKESIYIILTGYSENYCQAVLYEDIPSKDRIPGDLKGIDLEKTLSSIIYTSGTTGHPKGVMLSHDNLFQNTSSILAYLKLEERDSIVNVLPFYYSYGNSVLHTHLAVGATIILENSMVYPHKIVSKMVEHQTTGFSGVPSTYNLLLNRTSLDEFDLSHLRYLTQAGGAMSSANIKCIKALLPDVQFFVMYGQTEASSRLSYLPPDEFEHKPESIGVAISGVELEVMDSENRPVKSHEVGEIYAKGKNIMLGYWNDAVLSEQVRYGSWLKTGDLAYKDDDGYLYIVGRSSEMIKSGAHRISPKDIEEVINEFDGVEEVAVVGKKDELLGQVIKAFVVKSPSVNLDKLKLMRHCKQKLASYKIPKQIEFIDEIPRTASGKIRRISLQE